VADQCPYATFFHTPVWAEATAVAGISPVESLLAEWPDGRKAVLVVGLRRIWGGLVTAARTGLHGGYGGIIANGPLATDERQQIFAELKRRYPECTGTTNPFAGEEAPAGFTVAHGGATRVMTLGPLAQIRQGYNRERQKAVRRYEKGGVTVRLVRNPDKADLQQFCALYRHEVEAWKASGRSIHRVPSDRWFEALFRLAKDRLQLAFASIDGEVVGVNSYAPQGPIASELYLAWDRRHQSSQVSTALKEACLVAAWEQGLTQLDFMASGDLDGVERFKISFGANALPVWQYSHQSRLSRLFSNLKAEQRQLVAGLRPG
jgi:hypothetical protein